MPKVYLPQPLWLALLAAQRAWSISEEQATARASMLIYVLQQQGLVATLGSHWIGNTFVQNEIDKV